LLFFIFARLVLSIRVERAVRNSGSDCLYERERDWKFALHFFAAFGRGGMDGFFLLDWGGKKGVEDGSLTLDMNGGGSIGTYLKVR
jgi:hypothetical protein